MSACASSSVIVRRSSSSIFGLPSARSANSRAALMSPAIANWHSFSAITSAKLRPSGSSGQVSHKMRRQASENDRDRGRPCGLPDLPGGKPNLWPFVNRPSVARPSITLLFFHCLSMVTDRLFLRLVLFVVAIIQPPYVEFGWSVLIPCDLCLCL